MEGVNTVPRPIDLRAKVGRLQLDSPFMLASGILGNEHSLIMRAYRAGASAVVTKTVFNNARSGYTPPIYFENEYYALNAVGLPGTGVEHFSEELALVKEESKPLIASVGGLSPGEFSHVAQRVIDAGADAVELNLSCPHVAGTGSEIGSKPDLVKEVVFAVRDALPRALIFAKLTPNTHDIGELGKAAVEGGADGLTAVNTLRGTGFDVTLRAPLLSHGYGGVSGHALHPVALYAVQNLRTVLPDTPIIGVGGVYTIEDALEFFIAGADAVQIGTAIRNRGLQIFGELRADLTTRLRNARASDFLKFKEELRI